MIYIKLEEFTSKAVGRLRSASLDALGCKIMLDNADSVRKYTYIKKIPDFI